MSRHNSNSIDKFGRQKTYGKSQFVRGPPGYGFKLTADGQYDIQGKSLENVAFPKNANDAATPEYVLNEIEQLRIQIIESAKKDIKRFFELTFAGFDEKLNLMNDLVIETEKKFYKEGATREYVDNSNHKLGVNLTALINNEVLKHFSRHGYIEKEMVKLKELVTKNKGTPDSITKELRLYCEQQFKGVEEKIHTIKDIVMKNETKTAALEHKFKTFTSAYKK